MTFYVNPSWACTLFKSNKQHVVLEQKRKCQRVEESGLWWNQREKWIEVKYIVSSKWNKCRIYVGDQLDRWNELMTMICCCQVQDYIYWIISTENDHRHHHKFIKYEKRLRKEGKNMLGLPTHVSNKIFATSAQVWMRNLAPGNSRSLSLYSIKRPYLRGKQTRHAAASGLLA
jgi:hypothetical protein